MSRVTAFVVVASFLVAQASAQHPGADEMKEFGKMMVGKWVGESVIDVNLPGICKKGDKLVVEMSIEWALEGSVILTRAKYDVNGKTVGEGVTLTGWDQTRKAIRARSFGSLGGTGSAMWKKQGDEWRSRGQGILPNGDKHSGVSKVTVVDAYTHIYKSTDRKVGDEDKPDLEVTYKRVK